jgi:DNA-binding beta-propeller fold protein YncE
LAAVLLGAAPRPATYPIYDAPAGVRPAGASAQRATDAVLPDGRIAAPLGVAAFVGTDPLGLAISPDGRFAIVGNAEQNSALGAPPPSAPNVVAGYSLAVVDTSSMRVVSVYRDAALMLFRGLAATSDPADPSRTLVLASDGEHGLVRSFDLGVDGTLTPDRAIAVPGFPDAITLGAGGRVAYVASSLAGRVTAIDLGARRVIGSERTGYFPAGIAATGDRLFVANGGLSTYAPLAQPVAAPKFSGPTVDQLLSSSLSVLALGAAGALDSSAQASNVPMDPIPDGMENIGGARPDAIVARHAGGYAYVTLANVDRVAAVELDPEPHVVPGLDLRLFVTTKFNAPYGTQPSAEALSRDDKRLYVALAGLNAVAVLDASIPAHLHRLGLIPTACYPSALALSPDGRYLYIAAAKGVDGWGELQRVDLQNMPLEAATLSALRYNRTAIAPKRNSVVPALRTGRRSSVIDHVIYIAVGDESYDAIFGDLGRGNGDPSYVTDGAGATPNLHALANAYGIADNFYVANSNLDANAQASLAGAATLYTQRVLHVNTARLPLDDRGDDPEDYPRAGYLFNACSRAGLSYRDYGALLTLSGYRAQLPEGAGGRSRGRSSQPAAASGLGGTYTLDVAALAALDGQVDLNYAGWNPEIGDDVRVAEFIADMGRLVQNDQEPTFTYLWLPAGATGGMAAADRALGQAVAFLSRTPHWSSTAIFVVGEGVAGPRDHVNRARSYALVVSPLAHPGYVGHVHLSVASVFKTEEELLGLSPLSLADLLSSDMADFFGQVPYPTTYQALP